MPVLNLCVFDDDDSDADDGRPAPLGDLHPWATCTHDDVVLTDDEVMVF